MQVSKMFLMVIAAVVWYGGGLALFLKAAALVRGAYALDSVSVWTYATPVIGIIIGLIKTKLIFNHACSKNITRIRSLAAPRAWQFFRPGMLIFLAIIIPAGATMSRMAAGKFGWMCFVAGLDLTIGTALLVSGLMFWKMRAFAPAA